MRQKVADYIMKEIEASQREEDGQITNESTPTGSVFQVMILPLHVSLILPKLTYECTDFRPRRPPVWPVRAGRCARRPGHVPDDRRSHPTATSADPADLAHITEQWRAARARASAGRDAASTTANAARAGTDDSRCTGGRTVEHEHGLDDAYGDDAHDESRLCRSTDAAAAAATTARTTTATVAATATATTAATTRKRRLGVSASTC
jgi:hypothetical protein